MRWMLGELCHYTFFFQAEDGIRVVAVTGVQTCALPISAGNQAAEVGPGAALEEQGPDLSAAWFPAGDRLPLSSVCQGREIGRASCRERVEILVVDVS